MQPKRLLQIGAALVVLFCAWQVITAFITSRTSGVLALTSSDKNATLSVSQPGRQAKSIGFDSARVRLKPGTYTVSAADNGYQVSAVMATTKQQTVKNTLTLPPAASTTKSNGLLALLPYEGAAAQFQITTAPETIGNLSGPVITITAADSAGQQAARDWIGGHGYRVSDFTVRYQTAVVKNYHYTDGL